MSANWQAMQERDEESRAEAVQRFTRSNTAWLDSKRRTLSAITWIAFG